MCIIVHCCPLAKISIFTPRHFPASINAFEIFTPTTFLILKCLKAHTVEQLKDLFLHLSLYIHPRKRDQATLPDSLLGVHGKLAELY